MAATEGRLLARLHPLPGRGGGGGHGLCHCKEAGAAKTLHSNMERERMKLIRESFHPSCVYLERGRNELLLRGWEIH